MADQIPLGSVVVGVDGSESSGWALQWALQDCRRRSLPLALVHTDDREAGASAGHEDPVLEDAVESARRDGPDVATTTHHRVGHAAGILIQAASTATTVVLGSGARAGAARAVLGSVSHQVATHGDCPVVVVRRRASEDGAGAGRVVLALDDSVSSTPAVEYAFAAASRQQLGLTAVHVWWREYLGGLMAHSPWEGDWSVVAQELEQTMEHALVGWCEKYPDVPVHRHLVRGHAVQMLVRESESAELLVVGSRGHGGFPALLLGSVSNGVLQHADCPVAVVHQLPAGGA
jgi:nucleotide-binding universal stress UspA family protein